ncbi:hypothetical protein D9M68_934680 [compost metagenome]
MKPVVVTIGCLGLHPDKPVLRRYAGNGIRDLVTLLLLGSNNGLDFMLSPCIVFSL